MLIGEAYAYGIMDGEWLDNDQAPLTFFHTLRAPEVPWVVHRSRVLTMFEIGVAASDVFQVQVLTRVFVTG